MPAKSGWIFIFVCKKAVIQPQRQPARKPAIKPRMGWPLIVNIAHTQPPVAKDPSTVKSGVFMTRKEIYSPKERTAKIKPSSAAFVKIASDIVYSPTMTKLSSFWIDSGNVMFSFSKYALFT